jgi:RNA polymerase sigma-70 factor (ECF subfamily)
MDDESILTLYHRREPAALTETASKYGRLCSCIAGHILGNPQDAEECVNDSLLRLWQRIPPDSPDSLGSYLSRILRNLCLDRLRQQGALKRGGAAVTVCLDELEQVVGRGDAESGLLAQELGRAVDHFLRTQSEEARGVFLRRYYFFDERSEIAARYGISAAKVSVILSRTRKRLRNYLKQEGLL